MSFSPATSLSREEAYALWERLLADDAAAPAEIAVTYLDRLTEWLIRHNPRIDPDDCSMAAGDAIVALIKHPESYKPERQTLEVYLRMSASGDLKNLLRAERRHARRRADLESVELSPNMGKYLRDESSDPALALEEMADAMAAAEPSRIPDCVQASLSPQETKVMELMQRKERKTAAYAAALEIAHLPFEQQQQEVKRVKDRLKKRVERAGGASV